MMVIVADGMIEVALTIGANFIQNSKKSCHFGTVFCGTSSHSHQMTLWKSCQRRLRN